MKFSIGQTIYSGTTQWFPAVAHALHSAFPCTSELMFALDNKDELVRRAHWTEHVLLQCTFSYLTQDYIKKTIVPALELLPQHDALTDLRAAVEPLHDGTVPVTATSIARLNEVGAALLDRIEHDRIDLLTEAMNKVGRTMFSTSPDARAAVLPTRWLLWSCVVGLQHIPPESMLGDWQEAISNAGPPTSDPTALKKATIAALEQLRDNCIRAEDTISVFRCGDIKLSANSLRLGEVEFLRASDLSAIPEAARAPACVPQTFQSWEQYHAYEAYAVVRGQAHPQHLASGTAESLRRLDLALGYLSSLAPAFCPAPRHDFVAWAIRDAKIVQFDQVRVSPENSLVLVKERDAAGIQQTYDRFIEPAISTARPTRLRVKARRVLRTLRKASFHAGCLEHTEALGALWRACESLFAGTGEQERGKVIAKRLSVFVVTPTGERTDADIVFTDSDMAAFATDLATGTVAHTMPQGTVDALTALLASPSSQQRLTARFLLIRDGGRVALDWLQQRYYARREAQRPDRDAAKSAISTVQRTIADCYRLRNDLSHDAYAHDAAARVAYDELFRMLAGNLPNIFMNLSKHATHDDFLEALDGHYRLITEGPNSDELRERAHEHWEKRGCPLGDDWADWFSARREFRLDE